MLEIRGPISTQTLAQLIKRSGSHLRRFTVVSSLPPNAVLELLAAVVGKRLRTLEIEYKTARSETKRNIEAEDEESADAGEASVATEDCSKQLGMLLEAAPKLRKISINTFEEPPEELLQQFIDREVGSRFSFSFFPLALCDEHV